MSVQELKKAIVASAPQPNKAIVSFPLFSDLMVAGELDRQVKQIAVPTDPALKGVIEDWLVSEGYPTDLTLTSWHLRHHNNLEVLQDIQVGLSLAASGPSSFQLK